MLINSGTKQFSGGYHDDGEPKKTAGWPIFLMIEQFGLTNLCILVVRYYGGIKLGSGGLIRAYRQSAQAIIAALVVQPVGDVYHYLLEFDYQFIKVVDQFCLQNNLEVVKKVFHHKIGYEITTAQTCNFKQLPVKILKKEKTEIR